MRLFFTLTSLILLASCGNDQEIVHPQEKIQPPDQISTKSTAEVEQEAARLYQKSPSEALPLFNQLSSAYTADGKSDKAAIAHLNAATLYEEQYQDYLKAKVESLKALEIWKQRKDDIQEANLLKYIGFLEGKMKNLARGRELINEALSIYAKEDYQPGIATCFFNLARIEFDNDNVELANLAFNKSKEIWIAVDDKSRIFTLNTFGLELFKSQGNNNKVQSILRENVKLMSTYKIPYSEIQKFNALVKG